MDRVQRAGQPVADRRREEPSRYKPTDRGSRVNDVGEYEQDAKTTGKDIWV